MLFSDVDGTLLDGRTPRETLRASWASASRSVEVVLASSRTVEELVTLLDELGGDGDVIAENGCCIAVRAPQLARALGATEAFTHRGRRWYVSCRGASADAVLAAIGHARQALRATMRFAHELPPALRAARFGTPAAERRALARRCTVLVEPPASDPVNAAWLLALRKDGYAVELGGRWLAVWQGPDKGDAVRTYLEGRRAVGDVPRVVGAVGDGENDASMLRAVARPLAVQQTDGNHHPALRAVPCVETVAAKGHAGWRVAVAALASSGLTPALS
ncbi:MAG: HAD hydrolase family protein [Gemmatimonadales bacterium]